MIPGKLGAVDQHPKEVFQLLLACGTSGPREFALEVFQLDGGWRAGEDGQVSDFDGLLVARRKHGDSRSGIRHHILLRAFLHELSVHQ